MTSHLDTSLYWVRKLYLKLKRDLSQRIKGDLACEIIENYWQHETNRLDGTGFELHTPGDIQYWHTVNTLNETSKELSIWIENNHSRFEEELELRINLHTEELGRVLNDQITWYVFVEYSVLEKHCFYHSAMLTLLNSLRRSRQNSISNSSIELSISQHACVYWIISQNIPQKVGEEMKRNLEYFEFNRLSLTESQKDSFARSVRRLRMAPDWTIKKLQNRLTLLESIRPSIELSYGQHIDTLNKEINYFLQQMADIE